MCDCHSILECCVVFFGVKLSIKSFNLFIEAVCLQFYQSTVCSVKMTECRFVSTETSQDYPIKRL